MTASMPRFERRTPKYEAGLLSPKMRHSLQASLHINFQDPRNKSDFRFGITEFWCFPHRPGIFGNYIANNM